MGVPVFFKWLTMRNPRILLDAQQPDYEDFNSGNPSIDNFYVDMNGLIHPAVNPKGENIKVPTNFEQQCQNIYLYMDKIINIVRPKRFLYLAIDGVAPRAKMNQQRSRRFRAAMEGEQSKLQKQRLYEQYKKMQIGSQDIDEYVFKQSFDSNLITPGTKFLCQVSDRIRKYVKNKLATDKLWKNLTVVFSDANCPGQGEHKIMDFIRQQRASANYNPNQSHCIYGADADLIMLGLATHEPRFFIIRQIVVTANDKWCTTCGKKGHFFTDCAVADSIEAQQKVADKLNAQSIGITFQFIKIKAVRQFIHVNYEHCTFSSTFAFDLERIIDDFIFLCFFVGNDFLPHIPCLSIRDGGIDVLMRVYEHCLKLMPDYVTKTGHINMQSLDILIKQLSSYQPELVSELINKQTYQKQRQNFEKNVKPNMVKNLEQNQQKKKKSIDDYSSNIDPHDLLGSFKQEVKRRITPQINLDDYSAFNHDIYSYKEKYYSEKFRIQPKEFLQLKNNISTKYIEALQWICRYYYQGVPSWDWFYPFHYSPFLTDIQVPNQNTKFELGRPFKPFQQLMGVLPPKTFEALPSCLHHLMLDRNSQICDYFPSNFVIDIVGKKFAWLGEVLLPFIDSKRLLVAMGNYELFLSIQQLRMNKLGTNNVYISRYGQLGRNLSNTQNLQLGQKIKLSHEDHNICGQVVLLMQYNQTSTYEFYFYQPFGLEHNINLKQGIQYNPLEQIDQDFVSRTDKKSFGGERFVRIVERSLGRKIQIERKKDKFNNRKNNLQSKGQERNIHQRNVRQQRDRSRETYNNRNNNWNNDRNNDRNNYRGNYRNNEYNNRQRNPRNNSNNNRHGTSQTNPNTSYIDSNTSYNRNNPQNYNNSLNQQHYNNQGYINNRRTYNNSNNGGSNYNRSNNRESLNSDSLEGSKGNYHMQEQNNSSYRQRRDGAQRNNANKQTQGQTYLRNSRLPEQQKPQGNSFIANQPDRPSNQQQGGKRPDY